MLQPQPVVLYTKPGCHLCDQAEVLLARLAAEFPHTLVHVDITTDETLYRVYGERIPVFRIAQTEVAAPISEFRLRRALRAGAAQTSLAGGAAGPAMGVDPGGGGQRTG